VQCSCPHVLFVTYSIRLHVLPFVTCVSMLMCSDWWATGSLSHLHFLHSKHAFLSRQTQNEFITSNRSVLRTQVQRIRGWSKHYWMKQGILTLANLHRFVLRTMSASLTVRRRSWTPTWSSSVLWRWAAYVGRWTRRIHPWNQPRCRCCCTLASIFLMQ